MTRDSNERLSERYEMAIREGAGDDAYEERTASRHQTLRAIEEGLLSRFLYVAVR